MHKACLCGQLNMSAHLKFQKSFGRLYMRTISAVAKSSSLTLAEADVLLFFANNPDMPTSIDAVNTRGFSKAYVSKAVVTLLEKGLISIETSEEDRRYRKIFCTQKAKGTVEKLQQAQRDFIGMLTIDFSKEDYEAAGRLFEKLKKNLAAATKGENADD